MDMERKAADTNNEIETVTNSGTGGYEQGDWRVRTQ